MSTLKALNIKKQFNKNLVLNTINLQFDSGKVYGICGENGCGKTVLLKIICGLMKSTEGSILYNDVAIADVKPTFGVIFNGDGFFLDMNCFDNLLLLSSIRHVIGKEKIIEIITAVGLDPYDKRAVRKYSLGMKQRLSIAQALMENDDILLLDEPTNALDEGGVQQIHQLIRAEREKGKIIILTSHNRYDIDSLCDVVYKIQNGKVMINE